MLKIQNASATSFFFPFASILALTSAFAITLISGASHASAAEPSLPYSPSLDLTSMNLEVQPCQDFYQYSCGGWIKKNPIPADQASWDVYSKLTLDNETFIRALLEEASAPSDKRTPAQQKIGDYYHACMDEAAIEKADVQPLRERLDKIQAIQSLTDLSRVLAQDHSIGMGQGTLFSISSDQDYSNSQSVIAFASRAQLGLPDRDYYTKMDAKSVEIRARYVEHLRSSFELLGDAQELARTEAAQVMDLESQLAKSMLTRVEMRDPRKLFHKMPTSKFKAMVPAIAWNEYFQALGIESAPVMNVTEPKYYSQVQKLLRSKPLPAWRAFLRWTTLRNSAPYLSAKFANSDFEFYKKYLHGVKEQRPRWRRCAAWTDAALGEALGQVFVAKTFTPETKSRAVTMTTQIEEAMGAELKSLPWMTEGTRQQAQEKLRTLVNKVGYPEKWRDYSALSVQPDDFAGDVLRANQFETRRQLAKIGKPLDRTEWGMTPPTVNAYYNAQMNDINFPAGVLQPPLFDPKMDDAPNYGNTGATIGHELTHAFDDEGRRFDANGNLKDWWTKQDAREFEKRAKCVSDQYSGYVAVDDMHVNGRLTNGEDIADLGGTRLGYLAWKRVTEGQPLKPIDGLSPEQRYFVGMAQWACGDMRTESRRDRAITDPHSPLEYRINGVVANMPEFAAAFSCKKGQPMVRDRACRIW